MIINPEKEVIRELIAFPSGEVISTNKLSFQDVTKNLISSWFDNRVRAVLRLTVQSILVAAWDEENGLNCASASSGHINAVAFDKILTQTDTEVSLYKLAYISLVDIGDRYNKLHYNDLDMLVRVLELSVAGTKCGIGKLVKNELLNRIVASFDSSDSGDSSVPQLLQFHTS